MDCLTNLGADDFPESPPAERGSLADRFTRNERLVHSALQKARRPMKAYELLGVLHEKGLKAPMTIYRALAGLTAKGAVQKIVSQNAFVCVDDKKRRQFRAVLTCRRCGETKIVPLPEHQVLSMFENVEMPIVNVMIEAEGDCGGRSGEAGEHSKPCQPAGMRG